MTSDLALMTGFIPWLLMMVMWLASVAFGVIAAAAMVTYVRRSWQLMRADEDGSRHDRILDGIDRMDTRLEAISERLARIEARDPRLLTDPEEE